MMTGTVYMVSDPNVALQSSMNANTKILVISGNLSENDQFIQSTGASLVSVLLPPPSASMMEMDGNIDGYIESYLTHLNTGNPFVFICVILRAVYNGMNVILYTTPEEAEMTFMSVLADMFAQQFGIIVGTDNRQYQFDPRYYNIVLDVMYMNDMMTSDEFIYSYPEGISLRQNEYVLMRLYNDIVPYIPINNPTIDDIAVYFDNAIIISKRKLIDPIGGYKGE